MFLNSVDYSTYKSACKYQVNTKKYQLHLTKQWNRNKSNKNSNIFKMLGLGNCQPKNVMKVVFTNLGYMKGSKAQVRIRCFLSLFLNLSVPVEVQA